LSADETQQLLIINVSTECHYSEYNHGRANTGNDWQLDRCAQV